MKPKIILLLSFLTKMLFFDTFSALLSSNFNNLLTKVIPENILFIYEVLELGIVVHSVIIGVSLGTSESAKTIKPLVGALSFHQFFEGVGLGGCIVQANFRGRATVIMAIFFSLTAPFGIALGIAISSSYNANSSTALIIEGVFDAASAGILIYMSLVDLLAADFTNPRMQNNVKLQLGAHLALLSGSAFMSLLATWA